MKANKISKYIHWKSCKELKEILKRDDIHPKQKNIIRTYFNKGYQTTKEHQDILQTLKEWLKSRET